MLKKKLKILSLCDGLSSGLEALKLLGVEVEYHAIEIDPLKRQISNDNHQGIIRPEHDVVKFSETDIGYYDIVMCGFTCTTLTSQGSRIGWDGDSKIFFDCLKIVKKVMDKNPNAHFFFENVASMAVVYRKEISENLGVEEFLGESALVSGQDRFRYYWFNWEKPLIEDKGITASSCLDEDGLHLFAFSKSNRNKKGEPPIIKGRMKNNGKSATLVTGIGCTGQSTMNCVITKKMKIRYLRVKECARLQGIPDYIFNCSNGKAFKAIGDAWSVQMIVELFKACPAIKGEINAKNQPINIPVHKR